MKMTKHPREYFDRLLRNGLRADIRAHWGSMAFKSSAERRPWSALLRLGETNLLKHPTLDQLHTLGRMAWPRPSPRSRPAHDAHRFHIADRRRDRAPSPTPDLDRSEDRRAQSRHP